MKRTILYLLLITLFFVVGADRGMAQKASAKVYWMITVEVPLGKLAEYHAFAQKELMPAQEKYGYRYIGNWQTIVGDIEQAISICEFENMEAYNTARRNFVGSDEWKQLSGRFNQFIKKVESRFLRAAPYSGIQ